MNRWSSARKSDAGPGAPPPPGCPRTSGCVVTHASQPRCARIATTQSQNPGMTPSPVGTWARRRCERRAAGRSGAPSVTARRARSRRPRPGGLAQPGLERASRSLRQGGDVGLGESCHRAPPSVGARRVSSLGRGLQILAAAPARRRPSAGAARGPRRALAAVARSASPPTPPRPHSKSVITSSAPYSPATSRNGRAAPIMCSPTTCTAPPEPARAGNAPAARRAIDGRDAPPEHRLGEQPDDVDAARLADRRRRLARQPGVDLQHLQLAPATITSMSMMPLRPRPWASCRRPRRSRRADRRRRPIPPPSPTGAITRLQS